MHKRAELVRALNKAGSLAEQARLLDEIAQLDNTIRAQAAQDRELDLADTVVRQTLAPVRVHEHHTAATDWIGYEDTAPGDWRPRIMAEASAWYARTPAMVREDAEEYAIQAHGMARRVSGPYGEQAEAARAEFLQYAAFLNREAASGLDQIQQTIDGNNQPKTTELPTEVFDNFAPEVDPVNAGVSGTETSDRAPLIQEIVNGGSGMDSGQPEKPGGHSTNDELSWSPPSGMQADTAPGWSDGDPGTPEKPGGHYDRAAKESARTAGLDFRPGMAINHTMTLDDYRAQQATAKKAAALGKCVGCGKDLTVANAADREGMVCKGCAAKSASKREAASGLPMIQETVDANNQPHTPTPIPPDVAFPLDGDMQQEWTTDGTGNAHPGGNPDAPVNPGHHSAARKHADMWGNSDTPHAVVQPDVANTPATTPPPAERAGGAAAGAADARAENAPTFADDSTFVPTPAQQYPAGYASETGAMPSQDVPASMAGPGNGITHAGVKISSLITTATERAHADFKKGYGYGSRWTAGTRLVTTGSKEFEAGIYAGISDNAENQGAFVEAHREAAARFPALGKRIDAHKRVTARVVSKNEVASTGLYLLASTSIDLNTTAPNTTPAADGSTPINGPGKPGPLAGEQNAAAPGGPAPYNGAEPFGAPVVPGANQAPQAPDPTDALIGPGNMSTNNQVMSAKALAFRQTVQASLLATRQGK